jgi:hypothetical protein
MRFLTLVLIIGSFGCSPKKPEIVDQEKAREALVPDADQEKARQALVSDAGQIRAAVLSGDHQRMVDYTHPAVVSGLGGKENFKKRLSEIDAEMAGQGFRVTGVTLGVPGELVASRGSVYGILPMTITMSGPNGAEGFKSSCLIGVSTDRGASWKFIDGAGVSGDRAKLRKVLPDFPERLILPPVQAPLWK